VTERHLRDALAELRDQGGELTQTLLGARRPPGFRTDADDEGA
jgi:hypothetical protein